MNYYGMQSSNGQSTAAENIAKGNAIASAQRAQSVNAAQRARTQALNAGMGQANSLGRVSAYDQYRQAPSPLDAFHPAAPAAPAVTAPGRLVSPGVSDALFGTAPNPATAVAGTGATAMTPYGPISSRPPSESQQFGKGVVNDTGVQHFGGFNSQQEKDAARTQLLSAHPEIGQAGTAANQAFTAYAQQHGEQAAHQNVANILVGSSDLNPNGNNTATAIPSGGIPQAPKTAQLAPPTAPPPNDTGFIPGSPLAKSTGFISDLANNSYNAFVDADRGLGFRQPDALATPADPRIKNVQPGRGVATARALGLGTSNYSMSAYQ